MTKHNSPKSAKATEAVPNGAGAATTTARLAATEQTSAIQQVVGTIFQNDSSARLAIAENLKERSVAGKAFMSRAQQAFASFKPSKYPSQADIRPNYLKPGDSLAPKQQDVITQGLDAFRNSTAARSIKLAKGAELDKLIKAAPANGGSIAETIALTDLMLYIEAKSEGGLFAVRDKAFTSCKAEEEADRRMAEIRGDAAANDSPVSTSPDKALTKDNDDADGPDPDALDLSADKLVKDNVDLQMDTASSPESELSYSIPARSDQMKDRHDKPTFELRSGASDVTAFHDFNSLQIAFADVWTELFDDQLTALGKQLFEEYVRLKDFSGVDDGKDLAINTIDDLRDLMDKIRDFSRLTAAGIPGQLQPPPTDGVGSRQLNTGDVVQNTINRVLNPGGALIDDAVQTFIDKDFPLTWDSFGHPLPDGDIIYVTKAPIADNKIVEIVLTTTPVIRGLKELLFEDRGGKQSNVIVDVSGGSRTITLGPLRGDPIEDIMAGKLFFRKGKGFFGKIAGSYVLSGFDNIELGTRVTFLWMMDNVNPGPPN